MAFWPHDASFAMSVRPRIPYSPGMNPNELFTEKTKVLNVPAGQTLFREGEPGGDVMFVLVRGTADILVGEAVIEERRPGALPGGVGIDRRMPRVLPRSLRPRTAGLVPLNKEQFHALSGYPVFRHRGYESDG